MFIYTCLYLQTKAIKLVVSAYKTVICSGFENFSYILPPFPFSYKLIKNLQIQTKMS